MVYEDNSISQNQQVANNQPGLVGASPAGGQAPTTATSTGSTGTTTQSNAPQNGTGQTSVQNFNQANRSSPSGSFTNIKSYINANASAAPQLGQKIENNVSNSANAIKQGIDQSQNQFNQNAQNVGNQLNQGQNYVNQINTDPNQITGNQAALSQFRQLQNNTIAAPGSNLTGQEGQPIQDYAKQSGTEQGRFQLLSNMFKNPAKTYSQGQQNLDQLILQGSPNVANQLQTNLQGQAQGLQNQASQAQQAQKQAITNLTQLGAQDKQNIAGALGSWGSAAAGTNPASNGAGALGNLYSQLSTAQQAAQTGEQNQLTSQQAAINAVKSGTATDADKTLAAQALGVAQGSRLYGMDLSPYAAQLQLTNPNVSMADVANQKQAANVAALSQLANQNISLGTQNGPAGVNFTGQQSFNDALKQRASDYQNLINQAGWTNAVSGGDTHNSGGAFTTLAPTLSSALRIAGWKQDDAGKFLSGAQDLSQATDPNSPNFNAAAAEGAGQNYLAYLNRINTGYNNTGGLVSNKVAALQNILNNYGGFSGEQLGTAPNPANGDTTMGVT